MSNDPIPNNKSSFLNYTLVLYIFLTVYPRCPMVENDLEDGSESLERVYPNPKVGPTHNNCFKPLYLSFTSDEKTEEVDTSAPEVFRMSK